MPAVRRLLLCTPLLLVAACSRPIPTAGNGALPDFADLVDSVSPAVVNVSATQAIAVAPGPRGPGDEQSPFEDWLRRYFEQEEQDGEREPQVAPSLGSGFILWPDGYILTNRHVVRGAQEVVVRLTDRRQLNATVVGTDTRSDLALLKIDATGLPAVKIGDSTKLRVGEWVLAIGSPFGFDYSVTAGIVSAKGRSLPSEQYVPFIQTDVAINPGNSGGPLFNLAGEVVAINSQIYSQTGSYMGISFAIPIDVAVKVAQQLKERGSVERGWLGIVVQEVDRGLAESFGMSKPEGALVARVMPDSPAEKAGIKPGDIILRYNDHELPSSGDLPPRVGASDPGDKAVLQVMRDGKQVEIPVTVGALAGADEEVAEAPAEAPRGELGLVVRPLTEEERQREQVTAGGVMIERVDAGPARDAGLRAGDVLITLASQDIDSVERYREVVSRLTPGRSVPALVQRRRQPLFLALELPP